MSSANIYNRIKHIAVWKLTSDRQSRHNDLVQFVYKKPQVGGNPIESNELKGEEI